MQELEDITSNKIKHVTFVQMWYHLYATSFLLYMIRLSCSKIRNAVIFHCESLVVGFEGEMGSLQALNQCKQVTYCQRITHDTLFQPIMCQLEHFSEGFSLVIFPLLNK